ncbi:MAG: AMP-binding protein [Actinomycetes bacterium]
MPVESARRPLVRVPVPPGPDGPARLIPALAEALEGIGPAIAPIPVVSTMTSQEYVASLVAAVLPDDPDRPLEDDRVAVVACTSGSTGNPQGVLLTTAQLTAMSHVVNNGDPVWVIAIPVTSIGGLNVLVRSLATTHDPVSVRSLGGAAPFTADVFADAVDSAYAQHDDVRVSIVPAQLARLLDDARGTEALRMCSHVLVGAAATRPDLHERALGSGVRITTTYGSTETSGGCVFDGTPLRGVTVRGTDQPGQLVIDGPCVALGYRLQPELTRARFTSAGFLTPDLGTVIDGRVTVLGRVDDVVIIKGVNVSASAVEHAAAAATGVRGAAAVVGGADDPWIGVFVEHSGEGLDVADVSQAVIDRLGAAARPRWVRLVDTLPHLPNGKVDRQLLIQWSES